MKLVATLVAAPQKVEAATLHPPELRNRIR
jgi:hypothetical protein